MKTRNLPSYTKNQKSLLRLVIASKSMTRAKLAERSGFSLLTTSRFVGDFLNNGIVLEKPGPASTGGRKAGVLSVNPEYACVLAVDIGAYAVRVGVVMLDGTVLEKVEIVCFKGVVPVAGVGIDEIETHLQKLAKKYETCNLIGIGIGISGVVSERENKVVFCPNISGYNDVPLVERLTNTFGMPVKLNTSARCMALAEQYFGAGSSVQNQVFVSIGFSISAGIIVNGKIFSGAGGFSGEIGHLPVASNRDLCSCGNYDCLENYCTIPNILKRVTRRQKPGSVYSVLPKLMSPTQELNAGTVQAAAEQGDRLVCSVLQEVGGEIGGVLVAAANILNPDMIILGGGAIESIPLLVGRIAQVVREKSLITNQHDLRIERSALGYDCGLVGAAAQIIGHYFGE